MSRALLAVGAYGVAVLGAGVLAVALPGAATASGPVLAAAPVVAPAVVPSGAPSGAPSPAASGGASATPSSTLPDAAVGAARGVVDPFRPERIVLPDGARAPVVPAGVRDDGSLVVPQDPDVVGWWTGGSPAADAFGSTVIAGHVDSAELGLGVLFGLSQVREGQLVRLEAGGRTQEYRITSSRRVRKADLADDPEIFATDGAHRLVLITCGGRFDPVAHRYEDNLIVEATPV